MSSVYFGGSRHLPECPPTWASSLVQSVVFAGYSVHVGCQLGADQQVVLSCYPSSLVVFAVAPDLTQAPQHVQQAARRGARVVLGAGGSSAPIPARYLLRSIAAFQGCSAAVFFSPGPGSLAVARECVSQALPVFAFGNQPAPIPQQAGAWVPTQFMGLHCWQWSPAQLSFL